MSVACVRVFSSSVCCTCAYLNAAFAGAEQCELRPCDQSQDQVLSRKSPPLTRGTSKVPQPEREVDSGELAVLCIPETEEYCSS